MKYTLNKYVEMYKWNGKNGVCDMSICNYLLSEMKWNEMKLNEPNFCCCTKRLQTIKNVKRYICCGWTVLMFVSYVY